MKFSIDRDALLTALSRVSSIVSRRSTIPVLSNVLLDAGPTLTIRATDLDIEATVEAACKTAKKGKTTVAAQSLLDIAKATAEGAEIAAELKEGRLHVSAGRARWKLPVLEADQFPVMGGEIVWIWTATLPATDFANLIGRGAWAMCHDEAKLFIIGTRVEALGGELWACCTQTKQIAVVRAATDAPDFTGATVPTRACQEAVKFCEGRDDVTVSFSEGLLRLETPGSVLIAKLIAMKFAEWRRLLAFKHDAKFVVDRGAFVAAIRRAMIGAEMHTDGQMLRLKLTTGQMMVTGRSVYSEAQDEIEIDYTGAEASLGLNAAAMIDALGMMPRDDVTVEFLAGDTVAPVLIHCEGDVSSVCVSVQAKAGA